MKAAALAVGIALGSVGAASAAELTPDERAFMYGHITAVQLRASLCEGPGRRSLGAMCDDEPELDLRVFERTRRAHWTMKGPDALWLAVSRGELAPELARKLHRDCFGMERRAILSH